MCISFVCKVEFVQREFVLVEGVLGEVVPWTLHWVHFVEGEVVLVEGVLSEGVLGEGVLRTVL